MCMIPFCAVPETKISEVLLQEIFQLARSSDIGHRVIKLGLTPAPALASYIVALMHPNAELAGFSTEALRLGFTFKHMHPVTLDASALHFSRICYLLFSLRVKTIMS